MINRRIPPPVTRQSVNFDGVRFFGSLEYVVCHLAVSLGAITPTSLGLWAVCSCSDLKRVYRQKAEHRDYEHLKENRAWNRNRLLPFLTCLLGHVFGLILFVVSNAASSGNVKLLEYFLQLLVQARELFGGLCS
ncbi:hypothetical protein BDR26DRAFT_870472, partial [Obelidium mucronatum]